jgi:predicted Fe-Mo cluster-binding NifX family protein
MLFPPLEAQMRIAIPTWQGRVSPVFDTAQQLLIVEAADGVETGRHVEALRQEMAPQRAARIRELGIEVLICGAISWPLADMVAAAGVGLVPFINGECEQVLTAYLADRLPSPQFLMPGCCGRGRGRGFGPGAGMGRGRHRHGGQSPMGPGPEGGRGCGMGRRGGSW